MRARSQARAAALGLLYRADVATPPDAQERVALLAEHPAGSHAYALELYDGVRARRQDIDNRLKAAARHWAVPRMPLVDRNVLRLATYELFYGQRPVPPRVVIDEAVELAKRFGSEKSGAFVNGLLDRLWKEHESEAGPPAPGS